MAKEVDFQVSTADGKYTFVSYDPVGWAILRHGEPWIGEDDTVTLKGGNAFYQFACDLHAYRTGQGRADAQLPLEFANQIVTMAKLPLGEDGRNPLPVPRDRVVDLIARAVHIDRQRGPLNVDQVLEAVMPKNLEQRTITATIVSNLIRAALMTAQALGARMTLQRDITEDDYAEASRAGHETFMATLKNKGLL